MPFTPRPTLPWQLRTTTLTLGPQTLLMGILNCTPDSFSDGAPFIPDELIEKGIHLLDQGAHILDIGGESTRPGSHAATAQAISPEEEHRRILPVIQGILAQRPLAILSVDTYRASTAHAAVAAGCQLVNDVSGLQWDPDLATTVASLRCGYVLSHTRGRPDEWRTLPPLARDEVIPLVLRDLANRLTQAEGAGIARDRIVVDPGYGFGKAFGANYPLLAHQRELLTLGRPLLAGVSRKSFLGRTLAATRPEGSDAPAQARDTATIAALTAAILAGASIVRVHELPGAREAATIADAILQAC